MSSAFPISPFDPEGDWGSKGFSRLAKRLWEVGLFARSLRVQMRYGDLTRAPLRMIRFQLKESVAECDWIARVPDPWDAGLRPEIGQRHASLQALKDAVDVRSLLFEMLPDVDAAHFCIYQGTPFARVNSSSPDMCIGSRLRSGVSVLLRCAPNFSDFASF
jgi:hypothetical protein